MNTPVQTLILLALMVGMVAGCGSDVANENDKFNPEGSKDWVEVNKLKAKFPEIRPIRFDEVLPGNPVVFVNLGGTTATDADLFPLQGMTELRGLGLRFTHISDDGLERICKLTNLTYLELGDTKITDAGLAHLSKLGSLRELHLNQCSITSEGLKHISELKGLEVLLISGPGITDAGLAHLAGLTKMRDLSLSETNITTDCLRSMDKWSNLQALQISLSPKFGDHGLENLTKFPKLSSLSLEHTSTSDGGLIAIGRLSHLKELSLRGTLVSDAGLVHLNDMRAVRRLYLNGTHVTDAGVERVRLALPRARVFRNAADRWQKLYCDGDLDDESAFATYFPFFIGAAVFSLGTIFSGWVLRTLAFRCRMASVLAQLRVDEPGPQDVLKKASTAKQPLR